VQQQREVAQNYEKEYICSIGKAWPDIHNIRGLNLAVVKLTIVQGAKLLLWRKISKLDMICFAMPGLAENLYAVNSKTFQ
jgi:hypothetical protein